MMAKDLKHRVRDAVHPIRRAHRLTCKTVRFPSRAHTPEHFTIEVSPEDAGPATVDEAVKIVAELTGAIQPELADDGRWVVLLASFDDLNFHLEQFVAASPRSYLRKAPTYLAGLDSVQSVDHITQIIAVTSGMLVRTEDDRQLNALVRTILNERDTHTSPTSVAESAVAISAWWDSATPEDRVVAARLAEAQHNTFQEVVEMVADLNAGPA